MSHWGDSCVSHPFHTLVVTLRVTAWKQGLEPGGRELLGLRDAYLTAFAGFGSRADLERAADLAHRTGTIARALAWARYVATMDEPFRSEVVSSLPWSLKRFLAGGPLGSLAT